MSMTILAALLVIVGLIGIVAPVLPGLLLCWAGVLVWALAEQSTIGWITLAVATALFAIGTVVKYVIPGKQMRAAGVPWSTLAIGSLMGLVGFFVIPVLGLPIGFIAGIYVAERVRLDDNTLAWPSTVAALKGAGVSMLIEIVTGILMGVSLAAAAFISR